MRRSCSSAISFALAVFFNYSGRRLRGANIVRAR
jgi:hypothetical protein